MVHISRLTRDGGKFWMLGKTKNKIIPFLAATVWLSLCVSPPYMFFVCLFFFEFANWGSLSISNHLIWIGIKRLGWVCCMCGLHFLPQWWRNWSKQETIPGQLIFRNTKAWGSFIIQVFVWNKTIIGTGQGRKEIEILIRNNNPQNWEFFQCYVRF